MGMRKARIRVAIAAGILMAATTMWGCGPAREPVDSVTQTLTTPDGQTRSYHLHVPRTLDTTGAAPLLVALHGGFGSGTQFEASSGFDDLADANGFVVVYPDGTPIRRRGALADARTWNGGNCCGPAVEEQVDDVGFISALIDRVAADHHIDASRVYVTGHSNGAIMAYRLACERADKVVAVGVQAGALEIDGCRPSRPVSLMHVHGLADHNVPIDGGAGDGFAGVAFASPRESVRTFAGLDGCDPTASESVSATNADVTTTTWAGCDAGVEVRFVTVAGAGHAWMGHPSTPRAERLTGPPYMGFDSAAEIWSFLAAHPRI